MSAQAAEREQSDLAPVASPAAVPPVSSSSRPRLAFHPLLWLAVPLLAVVAYASVLRVGFLSDDLGLLYIARLTPWDAHALLWPDTSRLWYRPVGFLITWQFGKELWGFNPLPYHILGLAAHAGTALALGLWLASATANRLAGWLAGVVFAVFPGNLEAVAWIAAQWDAWAALFAIVSLWLFTAWWRGHAAQPGEAGRPGVAVYASSLLLYILAIFTKESVLAFLPVFALAAWLVSRHLTRRDWRVLALALTPFAAALAVNLSIRLLAWGNIPNYAFARTDYPNFFWNELVARVGVLLAPINVAVLGSGLQQGVGASLSVALLVALVWFGRANWRALLVGAVWIVLALAPTLNLPFDTGDLQNNRFLYLAAAGYCALVAPLILSARTLVRWKPVLPVMGALALVLAVVACWMQLRPFHTATVQVQDIDGELDALVPRQARANGMVWYVENRPSSYEGVFVLESGLGRMRYLPGGGVDIPRVTYVQNAAMAPLVANPQDAFALRFAYDPQEIRFHVQSAAGITSDQAPPSGQDTAVWDFRQCQSGPLSQWEPVNATLLCEAGKGLSVLPSTPDPQLIDAGYELAGPPAGARFLRLRVAVTYNGPVSGQVNQWFWKGVGARFVEARSKSLDLATDGMPHVYWSFVPLSGEERTVSSLRFDPANAMSRAHIAWIAADPVK